MPSTVTFSELARAAYCPRQLYYARRDDDRAPPAAVRDRQRLAFRYDELRTATDAALHDEPIAVAPAAYRTALERLAARPDWDALREPLATNRRLAGRDCRGVAHKLLDSADGDPPDRGDGDPPDRGDGDPPDRGDGDPPVPTLVSPGAPPEQGVWEPQRVRAVATAKALAWERGEAVPRALVEYPTHGVVRTVRLTTRSKALYRRSLRAVRSLDGPPPRLHDRSKCGACEYADRCGVRTRSMRSLLGR